MLNSLKKFFDQQNINESNDASNNLELLCGLMVEAANIDGIVDDNEVEKITSVLINIFKEDPVEVGDFLNKAILNKNNSHSLHYYTSKINKQYEEEKKIMLIETLWEIILSDGQIHDYESNLIRRLCGLLYISDVNSGNAKKRALDRIAIKK